MYLAGVAPSAVAKATARGKKTEGSFEFLDIYSMYQRSLVKDNVISFAENRKAYRKEAC